MNIMFLQKRAAFSSNNNYFASFNSCDKLTVWETSSNDCIIDCKLDSNIYGICTSLHWIHLQPKQPSPKKMKSSKRNQSTEDLFLAIGTNKGDIILYNITAKNLYSHLVARHSDAINDMSFFQETDSFFTCSSDKSIAVWNITSGKQKSHWVADDSPVTSICVLDGDNMLSSSKSIFWWNISEKVIIKKFSGHSSEIFKLLAVNVELSLSSCYFLSGAISELRINAWSLSSSDCETPVATFIPTGQPQAMDISKISLKEKHLILSVVTKEGFLNLFEHTLNGNVNQPLHPKLTVEIAPKPNNCESNPVSVFCTKLSSDSNSCIVAYGNSKENMIFKHIKIKDSPKLQFESARSETTFSEDKFPEIKESTKVQKSLSLNGLKSPSKSSEIIPQIARLKEVDTAVNSPQKQLSSSSKSVSSDTSHVLNVSGQNFSVPERLKRIHRGRTEIKDADIKDLTSSVGMLLKGIQTQNEEIINVVLHSSDAQIINESVKNLPLHTLPFILQELSSRIKQPQRPSSTVRIWIKEILRLHLRYLMESRDCIEALDCIKDTIESKRVHETISKMYALRGVSSLLIQNTSSDESDSENEEIMET